MGNLNLPQLAENQAAPEVTINDATNALDVAITDILSVDLSSANATLTSAQYRAAVRYLLTGVATSGRSVSLPEIKRGITIFECDTANTNSVALTLGTTVIALQPGRIYMVYTTGAANALVAADVGGVTGEPNDLHVFVPGIMVNAQLLYRLKVTRAFTLPISLGGSYVTAVTAATGSTTVTIKKNGSSIGTLVWSASGTVAAITFAAAVSFAIGDVLTLEGPATADATLADVSFDLFGTR